MKSYNIYLSGVGGQGIIKTSIVIGEAAMNAEMNVVMSEIHGMAQRGGVVSTELKIGDAKSPIIEDGSANLLISFEPLEALRSLSKINKEGYVITNTSPIMPFNIINSKNPYPSISTILNELESKCKKLFTMDAEKMAKDSGHILSLNMVMLGCAVAVPGFPIEKELILRSIEENLPIKTMDINMKAFDSGFKLCKSLL